MAKATWQTERAITIARARQDQAYRDGYEAGKKSAGRLFAIALEGLDVGDGARVLREATRLLKEDVVDEHNSA